MTFVIGLTTPTNDNNSESSTKTARGSSTSAATSIYLVQFDRLHAAIEAKRPRKKNHIVFRHDNARPHVARRVVESIANKGQVLHPHPPYSSTEAPTDYHLNRSLKDLQINKICEDLVAVVKAWIASKNRVFFSRGIDRLPSKWEAVIELDGGCAPE